MNWHRSEGFAPVMLLLGGREKHRLITSLREVAKALITAGPCDNGEEYMTAAKAYLDAIHGNLSPQDVHAALVRAAPEAGVSVITVVH